MNKSYETITIFLKQTWHDDNALYYYNYSIG